VRVGDVTPSGATKESGVSLNDDGRREHQRHADEADVDVLREECEEDDESDDEAGDAPTDPTGPVGVHVGVTNVLGETGVLLRKGLFKFREDFLFVL
jgi:hypothetical protein